MTDATSDTSLPNFTVATSEPVTVLYDCDYHHVEVGEAKTNFQNNNIHHQLIPTQIEFSGEEVSVIRLEMHNLLGVTISFPKNKALDTLYFHVELFTLLDLKYTKNFRFLNVKLNNLFTFTCIIL